MHQIWDKLFKVIGDYFPDDLVSFVLKQKGVQLRGKYEQEKISLEYQIADINYWVDDNGVEKLLNVEPYSNWKNSIPIEVFTRNGIITKSLEHKVEVISVVVLFEKNVNKTQASYTTGLRGQNLNEYTFPVVGFENIDEILEKYPPLAPFVLKVDPSYTEKVIEVVREHKILRYVTALVLNRMGMNPKEALDMLNIRLQEFREAFLDVPLMRDIWKEDMEKVREETKAEAIKETIMDLLEIKFGAEGVKLYSKINETKDLPKLATTKAIVKTATDIKEVQEYLENN